MLVGLITLPVSLFAILREPAVQDVAVRIASVYFSKRFDTDISIRGMYIDYLLRLTLKDVLIKDRQGADILRSRQIKVRYGDFDKEKQILRFDQVFLDQTDISLIKYEGDTAMSFDFIIREFQSDETNADTTPPLVLKFNNLKLYDSRFRLMDLNKPGKDTGMDFSNLDVKHINLNIDGLQLNGDTVHCDIQNLSADERSGFHLKKFKGMVELSPAGLTVEHLKMITNNSELSMNLKFIYDDFNAFGDFLTDVRIETVIGNSRLDLYDIGYFAPSLFELGNEFEISGTFKGPVSSLRAKNFKFDFGKSTSLKGNLTLNGLPDIYETFVDFDIGELKTTVEDIHAFNIPGDAPIQVPQQFGVVSRINLKGDFTGFYNDFVANSLIKTNIGNLNTDIALTHKPGSDSVYYAGDLRAHHFHIGKFLGIADYFGTMNLNTAIEGSGLSGKTAQVELNGTVDSLEFKGEMFEKIRIEGNLADKKFNGFLHVEDEKIDLDFKGKVDFSQEIPVFDFYADIDSADFYKLKMASRDSLMILSTVLRANFRGLKPDEMTGELDVDSTVYLEAGKKYDMLHLGLEVRHDSLKAKNIVLKSDYADASIRGTFSFSDLFPSLKRYLDHYLEFIVRDSPKNRINFHEQQLMLEIKLKQTDELTDLFLPRLDLNGLAGVEGNLDTRENILSLSAHADTIYYAGFRFDKFFMNSDAKPGQIEIMMGAGNLLFKEATENDSVSLGMDSTIFASIIRQDSILFRLAWDDREIDDENKGDVRGYVSFVNLPMIESRITRADLLVNDSAWRIDKDNFVSIDTSSINIKDFEIKSSGQSFSVNGAVSENPADTMALIFSDWRFSNFDLLMADSPFDLDGRINGGVNLINMYKAPNFISDIEIKEFAANKVKLGDLSIFSNWDNSNNALQASVKILKVGSTGSSEVMNFSGKYLPEQSEDNLDFNLNLDNFNLRSIAPLISDLANDLKGFASGNVRLGGNMKKPEIQGSLSLMRAGMRINYLNVPFDFTNQITISENAFVLKDMVLYDSLGNKARVEGKVSHQYFDDMKLDVSIYPEDLAVMNTNSRQNSVFYGSAFASGVVEINGPFDNLRLNITAETEKGTDVKIPITDQTEIYDRDYIVFVNTADTSRKKEEYKVKLEGLDLNLDLTATPDAQIQLFLPANLGNLKASGSGNIILGINPQGDFSINGDYVIKSGSFLFTLRNLVKRRFDLLEGGKISWTGSPYDAEIGVRAIYRVKSSLAGLGLQVDSTSNFSKRVNVNCIIELREQLFDPEIHFSIQLPGVDDQTRQLVYSVLDTNNEAQMNQQMISLLVLGSFSFQTQTFEQSSFSLLSNQLSNWLGQISKDFDIGVNYRPGDEISEEELEVALSTQLFNNRVIIDGNFGVIGDDQRNASNIVGDVNVEVKLTEDGRFRVRAFNRSNYNSLYDVTTFDDIAPYTQGIGIFYRKEFNTFGELFRKKKKDKTEPETNIQ